MIFFDNRDTKETQRNDKKWKKKKKIDSQSGIF